MLLSLGILLIRGDPREAPLIFNGLINQCGCHPIFL
jgi:hypothetical protein